MDFHLKIKACLKFLWIFRFLRKLKMTMPCRFCKWIFLLRLRLASCLVATLKMTKSPKNSPAHQKNPKLSPTKQNFSQKTKISQKIPKIPKNTKLTPKNPKNLPKPPQNITQITIFPQNLPKNFRPIKSNSPKIPPNFHKFYKNLQI